MTNQADAIAKARRQLSEMPGTAAYLGTGAAVNTLIEGVRSVTYHEGTATFTIADIDSDPYSAEGPHLSQLEALAAISAIYIAESV